MRPIHVIGMGMGAADLTPHHREIISSADILVGGRRHLALFPDHPGETHVIDRDIPQLISRINLWMRTRQVVILASGDPLFHGIGTTLSSVFDPSLLRIHPNVSVVGAAFAALCEPWDGVRVISLHGEAHSRLSAEMIRGQNRVAILTDHRATPEVIARCLIQCHIDDYEFIVLEHIGSPDNQRIQRFDDCHTVLSRTFECPNVVVLRHRPPPTTDVPHETQEAVLPPSASTDTGDRQKDEIRGVPPKSASTHPGMADHLFHHTRGVITKSEVRSISLSRLQLTDNTHTLWDIGAGSGAVSIEAAGQLPLGRVVAFEKNPKRCVQIRDNIARFNVGNIQVIHQAFPPEPENGCEPDTPEGPPLPSPDRIFIGGGGPRMKEIIDAACTCLTPGGIVVINTVLIESMQCALSRLTHRQCCPEVIQVQVSRGSGMPFGTRFQALNPVWIIWGRKPARSPSTRRSTVGCDASRSNDDGKTSLGRQIGSADPGPANGHYEE